VLGKSDHKEENSEIIRKNPKNLHKDEFPGNGDLYMIVLCINTTKINSMPIIFGIVTPSESGTKLVKALKGIRKIIIYKKVLGERIKALKTMSDTAGSPAKKYHFETNKLKVDITMIKANILKTVKFVKKPKPCRLCFTNTPFSTILPSTIFRYLLFYLVQLYFQ
jgi:hypothetical protein